MFQHRRGLNKALKNNNTVIDSSSILNKDNPKLKRRQDVGSSTQCFRLNPTQPYWVMLTDWP